VGGREELFVRRAKADLGKKLDKIKPRAASDRAFTPSRIAPLYQIEAGDLRSDCWPPWRKNAVKRTRSERPANKSCITK
jgi:hypothetical protein